MIQRIQTVWLLFASACAFLSMKFPFYFKGANQELAFNQFSAVDKIFLMILTSVLGTLCLFTIFIYKQRKLQLWLIILAISISILNIFLFFNYYNADKPNSGLALTSVFAFALPFFLFFAARGIYRDQKLVKSMDRLR